MKTHPSKDIINISESNQRGRQGDSAESDKAEDSADENTTWGKS